jgi:hypothetical protein
VFSVEERARVHAHVLELARADDRVVAGAVVGALALGEGDRWSDLDLTFAVADGIPVDAVLADWTRDIADAFDAVHLFDLPFHSTVYRVFLLPGCLQVDLSFTPAADFRARGPRFRLVFGGAGEPEEVPPPSARDLLGLGVHHAVRARFCIERRRWWQGEYWISGVRDQALSLACRRRGLAVAHGRGFDDLPADVLEAFGDALVRSLERRELLRALGAAVAGLVRESGEVSELAAKLEPRLRELTPPIRPT